MTPRPGTSRAAAGIRAVLRHRRGQADREHALHLVIHVQSTTGSRDALLMS